MMLIIPIMIPLLVIGMSALFESQINKSVEEYNKIGFDYELNEIEKEIVKNAQIDAVYIEPDKIAESYQRGEVDLYVTKEGKNYVIHGDDNETTSYAIPLVEGYFSLYKEYLQQEHLMNINVNSEEVLNIITVNKEIKEIDNF